MKKSVFTKHVRESLHNWRRRSKYSLLKDSFGRSLTTTSSLVSLDSLDLTDDDKMDEIIQEENTCLNSFGTVKMSSSRLPISCSDDLHEDIYNDEAPNISNNVDVRFENVVDHENNVAHTNV